MMREILFRGKRIDNGEWVEGGIAFEDYTDKAYIVRWNTFGLGSFEYIEVDTNTISQSTALCDKNGKKIFEGDICRNTKTGRNATVRWHGTMAGYVWSKRQENSHLYDFGALFRAHDKYEVIGDIHDNPELLEVDE